MMYVVNGYIYSVVAELNNLFKENAFLSLIAERVKT